MGATEVPLFDPQLARLGVEVHVGSGVMLWREGDAADHVILLLEGVLEVLHEGAEGEMILRTLEPGAVVGELAAAEGRARSAAVRTRTASRFLRVSSGEFREVLHARPDILEQLYWMQVERVRSLTRRVTKVQRRALVDSATGLYAHAFFQDRLEDEAHRARRVGDPLTLILVQPQTPSLPAELDGGEGVLATIGRLARRCVRRGDIVARYGRDGCAILLYGADRAKGQRISEALGAELERTRGREIPAALHVSSGVAALPEDADDAEGLLKAADIDLYRAQEGRQRKPAPPTAPAVPSSEVALDDDEAGELARSFQAMTAGRRSGTVSRAFLDNILRSMADTLLVTDGEGRTVLANQAALDLLGYESGELIGRHITDVCPEGWEVLRAWGGDALDRISFIRDVETTYRTKDGRTIPTSVSGSVMRDAAGRLQGVVWDAIDITERLRAQEELRLARDAAEQASQAKSSFLANMSHELRTPLNAIIGYSEIMSDELRSLAQDQLVEDLEKIHGSGKHLLGLINDILDLSKIEAGRMDVFLEPVSAAALLRDVVSTVRPLVDKKGNTLEVRTPEDAGSLHTDVTKLRQSLLNLLSNACKFTEEGRITLELAKEQRRGADWVSFRVTDSGIGMTPDQMSRLFQPFSQAEPSLTRKYGGTGLGLAITKRFCEMLGGEISAQSEHGKGSTFTIRLPAQSPETRPPQA